MEELIKTIEDLKVRIEKMENQGPAPVDVVAGDAVSEDELEQLNAATVQQEEQAESPKKAAEFCEHKLVIDIEDNTQLPQATIDEIAQKSAYVGWSLKQLVTSLWDNVLALEYERVNSGAEYVHIIFKGYSGKAVVNVTGDSRAQIAIDVLNVLMR